MDANGRSAARTALSLTAAVALLSGLLVAGGATSSLAEEPSVDASAVPALSRAGWTDSTYRRLVDVIAARAGTGAVATFDFDNTTQARDVGEATVGQSERDGTLTPRSIPRVLVPPIRSGKETVSIRDGAVAYYDALASIQSGRDPFNAYASNNIVAQFFTGRPLSTFVRQVRRAYADGAGRKDLRTRRESTTGGMPRPFVYPQMADLYGNLRAHGYDVWVVSAGVTWAVRWMVKHNLNPLIRAKYGAAAELPLDHVVGISTLLRDRRTGEVFTDYALARSLRDQAYLNLRPRRTRHLEILALTDFVNSWRGGKVGAIQNLITRGRPYLAGGDSQGDFEMLNMAENRLWITRLDRPDIQKGIAEQMVIDQPGQWLLQPTITTAPVGFKQSRCAVGSTSPSMRRLVDRSVRILEPTGNLGSFTSC